jgi:hypothetical protein
LIQHPCSGSSAKQLEENGSEMLENIDRASKRRSFFALVSSLRCAFRLLGVWLSAPILVIAISPSTGLGDFVIYTLPGTHTSIILEGKSKIHAGQLLEFSYPGFPSITMAVEDTILVKAPTRQEEYKRLFNIAVKSGNVADYLGAANQALQHGMLRNFYECCSAAYKVKPDHPVVQRLLLARKRIKQPLGQASETEERLRQQTKLSAMKVAVSDHYVMLHDTGAEKVGRRGQTRAETRLALLETVYESYFMKFALDGLVLDPPKEHLMVILFAEESDFFRYAELLDPQLRMAAGFWSPEDNISVFYDQGTTDSMKLLQGLSNNLQQAKIKARGTYASRDTAQLANAFDLLLKISREEADTEVVSHEATHQLAGNTGLMPREKIGLKWAHEGLASYFETPAGTGWVGVGAVNATRLKGFRNLLRDPRRIPLELLISDTLFDEARNREEILDAYGEAWGLTHYLMTKHFEKLVLYYRGISNLEVDEEGGISRAKVISIFRETFGDLRVLEQDFHSYANALKTDVQRMSDARR